MFRYLDYGEKEWKAIVREHLKSMELYCDEVHHNFNATLDWIQEHACSRSYGLGMYIIYKNICIKINASLKRQIMIIY